MTDDKNKLSDNVEKHMAVLTREELEFCNLVLSGTPPADAYRDAGLSPVPDNDAAMQLKNSNVVTAYIDAMQRQVATRSVMTLDVIDQRLSDIAMTDATDVVSMGEVFFPTGPRGSESAPVQMVTINNLDSLTAAQRAAISSIKPCPGGLEVRLHDKVKVMELLAKRRGGFVEKQEVTHSGGVEVFAYTGFNGRGPADDTSE